MPPSSPGRRWWPTAEALRWTSGPPSSTSDARAGASSSLAPARARRTDGRTDVRRLVASGRGGHPTYFQYTPGSLLTIHPWYRTSLFPSGDIHCMSAVVQRRDDGQPDASLTIVYCRATDGHATDNLTERGFQTHLRAAGKPGEVERDVCVDVLQSSRTPVGHEIRDVGHAGHELERGWLLPLDHSPPGVPGRL